MTSSPTTRAAGERRAAVGVDELRRAWRAAQTGQFRRGRPGLATATVTPPPGPPTPAGSLPLTGVRWEPVEPVVAVVACSGPTGASAVALAVATVAGAARVIDCVVGTFCIAHPRTGLSELIEWCEAMKQRLPEVG